MLKSCRMQLTDASVCCHLHTSQFMSHLSLLTGLSQKSLEFHSSPCGRTKVKYQCATGMTFVARACSFHFTGITFIIYSSLPWYSEGSSHLFFSYSPIRFKKRKNYGSSLSLDALVKIFGFLLIHRGQ